MKAPTAEQVSAIEGMGNRTFERTDFTEGRVGAIDTIVLHGGGHPLSVHKDLCGGFEVDESDTAWHVGNWHCCMRSIAVEIGDGELCDDDIERLRVIVTDLMDRYGIEADMVLRHFDVSGAMCPIRYVDPDAWRVLKEKITTRTEAI